MLRRSVRRLFGSTNYGFSGQESHMVNHTGGLPFLGNMYQGRVNPEDYQPSQYSTRDEARQDLLCINKIYADDDPYIRAKMDKCPYFALCDLVVYSGMAPTFLDPGLLTTEEHHHLLLHSRAYYEKWTDIHSKPREFAPKIRRKKGRFVFTKRIFDYAAVPQHVQKRAEEMMIDDSMFVAMDPSLWKSAHLDERLRDELTGRVLEMAGVSETQMDDIFGMLRRLRTFVVKRKDLPEGDEDPAADENGFITFNYRDCPTLWNVYKNLGLPTYSGQLKLHSFVDAQGTPVSLSLATEDDYFDFLMTNFYRGDMSTPHGSPSRYVVTVEAKTRAQAAMGKWF